MQIASKFDHFILSLPGIIVLFVLCHMGEMIVSCYEIRQRLAQTEEEEEEGGGSSGSSGSDLDFPQWVRNLIVINHILIVANSSLNFAIYCKVLVTFLISLFSLFLRATFLTYCVLESMWRGFLLLRQNWKALECPLHFLVFTKVRLFCHTLC